MLWESYQQTKITRAERTAEKAQTKADRYAGDIANIKRHVDRLSLACQAMWELLREHSHLTEDDIEKKILEIDSRDGQADGRIATQFLKCESCGKPTNSKRNSCVMCGAPVRGPHAFEG